MVALLGQSSWGVMLGWDGGGDTAVAPLGWGQGGDTVVSPLS